MTGSTPDALAEFPFRVSIGCRHTDLDIQKAVHNVAIAEIFEEARTLYSVRRRLKPAFDPNRRVLRSIELTFLADACYPGGLDVGVGVAAISSNDWEIEMLAVQGDTPVASCKTRFFLALDAHPVALPAQLTAILQADLLLAL